MRIARSLNAGFILFLASTSFGATITWAPTDVGTDAAHVVIDQITPDESGLGASVDLQLISFTPNAFQFTATLYNETNFPSRLTAFGFNLDGQVGGASVTGVFSEPGFVLNGIFPELGAVDICFTNGNTCAGGAGTGIWSQSSGMFAANVLMTQAVSAVTLSNFGARFQSVDAAAQGTETPEPATLFLAGSALVLFGSLRSRRAKQRKDLQPVH